ncbi:MAG: hypothetical protein ACD_8C00049G0005 [uncultured bacterium]|nr:MAG: hypothetical protein ACD_8C00049G0005 [uncultured bacterium]
MNTESTYNDVKNPGERDAAMRLNLQIRAELQKKPSLPFEVKTSAPQFTEKAEKLVRNDWRKDASIEFSFNAEKEEVTATVTPIAPKKNEDEKEKETQ